MNPFRAQAHVIEALATALVERDRYTGEHSAIVVDMARTVADGLGLDEVEVERVGHAALLHDIGKVGMPDRILHKPGPLRGEEWELMREHPVIGERILRAIPGLGGVARIVRHEHERFDGSGYPDGLAGQAIPLGSRDHPRLRRLPRDDLRSPLPRGDASRARGRRAGALRGLPVRPADRRQRSWATSGATTGSRGSRRPRGASGAPTTSSRKGRPGASGRSLGRERSFNDLIEGRVSRRAVTGPWGAEFLRVRVRFTTPSATRHWGGLS